MWLALISAQGALAWKQAIVGADANAWQPTSALDPMRMRLTHRLNATIRLPQSLPPGHYKLGLYLHAFRPSGLQTFRPSDGALPYARFNWLRCLRFAICKYTHSGAHTFICRKVASTSDG